MNRIVRVGTVGGGLLALTLGCGGAPSEGSDPAARTEALRIWNERCANCHGPRGEGNGPQARYLTVDPRPLSDRRWRSKVSDEHLRRVILDGGPAVGLSPVMAPNPDLRSRPAVLWALVEHIRGL